MIKDIKFGKFTIGENHPPFIIAEMSGNHNQSLEKALRITEAAAKAGAHALKLQTYTADSLTLDVQSGEFVIREKSSLWHGESLHQLYQKASTPWEWHEPIMKRAQELGMLCFSTPFDDAAVDLLEKLDVPLYKIASFEIGYLQLVERVARTGKPIIVSTGMASVSDIEEAVRTIRLTGNDQIILLKCTSSYPANPTDSNIRTIPHLRDLFQTQVGLSDHTMGVGAAVASVALGGRVIEKHFTLSRAEGGVDSAFSLEPEELKSLVVETERGWQALGSVSYGPTEAEKKSLQFRRSIYVSKDMAEGEIFTNDNMRIVRPGHGLAPRYLDVVLGKRSASPLKKGTALTWDLVR